MDGVPYVPQMSVMPYEDLPMQEWTVGPMAGMKMSGKPMKGNMPPKVALDESETRANRRPQRPLASVRESL